MIQRFSFWRSFLRQNQPHPYSYPTISVANCSLPAYFWEFSRLQIIRTKTSEDATQRWQRLSAAESFTCCTRFSVDLLLSLLAATLAGVFHVCVQYVTLMEPLCLNRVNSLNLSLPVTEKDAQGGSETSMHSSLVTPEACSPTAKPSVVTLAGNATLDVQLIRHQWIIQQTAKEQTSSSRWLPALQNMTAFVKCLLYSFIYLFILSFLTYIFSRINPEKVSLLMTLGALGFVGLSPNMTTKQTPTTPIRQTSSTSISFKKYGQC